MYQLEIAAVSKKDAGNTSIVATSFGKEPKKASTQLLSLWHRRLAYVHHTMIKKMASTSMVNRLILEDKEEEFCVGCAYGKNHRNEFP
jgi:hypothetical protein